MSSYIVGLKTYLNVKKLSYLLIKNYVGPSYYKYQQFYKNEEELKDFIDNACYELYKNNVASVTIQYGDKVRWTGTEYIEQVGKAAFTENSYKFDCYAVASLIDALHCINYQIEIEYDKTFVNYIKQVACDYMSSKILSYADANDLEVCHWGLEEMDL